MPLAGRVTHFLTGPSPQGCKRGMAYNNIFASFARIKPCMSVMVEELQESDWPSGE